MFEVRPYKKEDYQDFCAWWAQWGWDAVPLEFLPADGVVVSVDGKPVCAVFIYLTNTPICWIENYISSKDCDKAVRGDALDLLILSALEKAKDLGACVAMSSIRHAGLGRRLEKSGFVVSDKNMTAYMRGL